MISTRKVIPMNSPQDLNILRHSAAHLLAHAVRDLFPKTQMTIGPATETGFFYDFLPEHNFKEEDLIKLEERMRELSAQNFIIEHTEITKEKARTIFAHNTFKLELIDGIPGDTVGLSSQGDFYDLCRGGHVASTGVIKYFKLDAISGSYWRADRNNQPLQRISGTAFFSQQELEDFLKRKEDLIQFDHRRLGKQLDLFSFHEEGPGFPFFHPKGRRVFNLLIDYMRTLQIKAGYQEISTPIVLNDKLWRQSGHYAHYKENMYFCFIDEQSYALKPMNCPGSTIVFGERPRSYRELPLRLSEFGLVHRHELSGVLHGLLRVRAFTQDDGHIYCTPEQIEQEVTNTITMAINVLKAFGFNEISLMLSTRPENSMGSEILWEQATSALKNALIANNVVYDIDEGGGAFYGPKIDFKVKDSMGRLWQLSTIQVDFFMPENFDLSYINSHGAKERPVMVHRAIYGSLERFFAIVLEHHKGHLPFFIAPVQVTVLTITHEQSAYAHELIQKLSTHDLRITIDDSSETISSKIKSAQCAKIPWMLVIGKKEVEQKTITLRKNNGSQEFGITLEQLITRIPSIE
jgi:threonyl-tRNA synthetase